jgi:predicted alpha/beta-hydrolase family hydrolase
MPTLKFTPLESTDPVSGILLRPDDAEWLYVLAHGAGAGMHHPFMESITAALLKQRIATFRYQFPYMEKGSKRPDRPPVATATVRAAVQAAHDAAPDLPIIAGGKSFGGRMTSTACADSPIPNVRGLAFLGFPLHAAGNQSNHRAEHLYGIELPMLFLQGTRDSMADLHFLRPVCTKLGDRAHLHVVEGGDHSFHVLKRSGRTDEEVIEELARSLRDWALSLQH